LKQGRQCTYIAKWRHVPVTIVAVNKNKYCMFWLCVYSIGIQHAMRMRHIVACPTVQYFSTYLINSSIFGKRVIEHPTVLLFSPLRLSKIYLILRRIRPGIAINEHSASLKVHVILVRF
jgi:hypothetical protein